MSGSAFVSAPASCAGAFVSALLAALVRWSICVRLGHTVRHFGLEPGAGAFLVRLDGLRGTRACQTHFFGQLTQSLQQQRGGTVSSKPLHRGYGTGIISSHSYWCNLCRQANADRTLVHILLNGVVIAARRVSTSALAPLVLPRGLALQRHPNNR